MGLKLCSCKNKDDDIPYVAKELINYAVRYDNELLGSIYNKQIVYGDNMQGTLTHSKYSSYPPHITLTVAVQKYGIRRINLESVFDSSELFSHEYYPILDCENIIHPGEN